MTTGTTRAVAAAAVCTAILYGCGGGESSPLSVSMDPSPPPRPLSTGAAMCTNGRAGDFPCDGISLHRRVALAVMGGNAGNDIWGWSDAQTGQEYALMGMDNGTAFVDVSDPENPVFLGRLPTQTEASSWRDIKVYRDHAYIVADNAGAHGMQVFDLTRLRGLSAARTFDADVVYDDFEYAHNLAINEETGFAYAVGTDTCEMGLHIIDIRTPTIRGSRPVTPRPRRTTPSASSTGGPTPSISIGRYASAPTKIISKWSTSPTSPPL